MKVRAKELAYNADGTPFLWKGKPIAGAQIQVWIPRMAGKSLKGKNEFFHWEVWGGAFAADTDQGVLEGFVIGAGNKIVTAAGDTWTCTYEKIPFILKDRVSGEEIASFYPENLDAWIDARVATNKAKQWRYVELDDDGHPIDGETEEC